MDNRRMADELMNNRTVTMEPWNTLWKVTVGICDEITERWGNHFEKIETQVLGTPTTFRALCPKDSITIYRVFCKLRHQRFRIDTVAFCVDCQQDQIVTRWSYRKVNAQAVISRTPQVFDYADPRLLEYIHKEASKAWGHRLGLDVDWIRPDWIITEPKS